MFSTLAFHYKPRSTPCVFLRYQSNHRGYKCLNLSSNKIIICRHVLFDKNTSPYAKLHNPQSPTYTSLDNDLSPYIINHIITQDQTDLSNCPPDQQQTTPPLLLRTHKQSSTTHLSHSFNSNFLIPINPNHLKTLNRYPHPLHTTTTSK